MLTSLLWGHGGRATRVKAHFWWDSVDPFAMLAIALQPALGLLGAVLPGTTHSPILIHQPEQISADAPEQRSLFHALTLARAVQDRNRTPHHLDQSGGSQPGWVRPEGVPTHHEHRAMTTTQH